MKQDAGRIHVYNKYKMYELHMHIAYVSHVSLDNISTLYPFFLLIAMALIKCGYRISLTCTRYEYAVSETKIGNR